MGDGLICASFRYSLRVANLVTRKPGRAPTHQREIYQMFDSKLLEEVGARYVDTFLSMPPARHRLFV